MAYDNPSKLARAKAWAKEQGKANDEDVIRERYIALGGLVTGDEGTGAVGSDPVVKNVPRTRKPVAPKTDTEQA